MPCDYSKYPKNWKAIRQEILKRADNECEFCGLKNHVYGYRDALGIFNHCYEDQIDALADDGEKVIRVVLTIAHMNHKTMDSRRSNLKALCQRCHNNYDADYRRKNRSHTLELKKTHPKQGILL